MPRIKKFIIALTILAIITCSLFIWLSDRYVVPIIMYHSVSYSDRAVANVVSPELFAWQMSFLKRHGYKVISLDQLAVAIKKGRSLSRESVVITFDDGYGDNYTNAFKTLKRYGFPAIIFISTDQAGKEGYLTWDQMREMEKYGITIGSHTLNQTYLPGASKEEQRRQIKESKEVLEKGLRHPIYYLSYPAGGFSNAIKETVRKSGYKGACTTNRGYNRLNRDVYELKRIRLSDKDNSAVVLWIKLSGYYNLFRKAKKPY